MLVKREVCAYRDQIPVTYQQNITHHFSLLWDRPMNHHCIGDIHIEKYKREKFSNF